MNPGKVVDPNPPDGDLRLGEEYRTTGAGDLLSSIRNHRAASRARRCVVFFGSPAKPQSSRQSKWSIAQIAIQKFSPFRWDTYATTTPRKPPLNSDSAPLGMVRP